MLIVGGGLAGQAAAATVATEGNGAKALLLEKGYVIPLYEYTRTWQLRDHLAGLAADHMGGYWLGGIQRVN